MLLSHYRFLMEVIDWVYVTWVDPFALNIDGQLSKKRKLGR
jgi:hypothetical protein